ncbi:MAG: hypothetical protein JXB47_05480 [Anaerolineae bacterium]|nr:hypothetical protein [Anaerolineae bacterium]
MTIIKRTPTVSLAALLLLAAALACSTADLGSGPAATPTPAATASAVFVTATPGGVISVPLGAAAGGAPGQSGPPAAGAEIVAPVGTATAAAARVLTATAEAAAPPVQATYQPGDCPAPRNPPPPARPATFAEFPSAIAQYLSAGGPTTLLEGALRTWGAITGGGGLVKVDTDVTGNGDPEVIITIYDPTRAGRRPQPGQLLIFGCERGGYRLLYASTQDPNIGLPELLRVGDMSGDARAEVVYRVERCAEPDVCTGEAQILTWDSVLGSFRPLNAGLISAPNARFGIGDVDGDGILELSVASEGTGDGPPRTVTQTWDWNGTGYLLAVAELAPARYRIHALHDADAAFAAGRYAEARAGYERVLDDETLLPWTQPDERSYLNAFALYRLVLAYAAQGDLAQAQAALDRLAVGYNVGAPGAVYTELARAFWDQLSATHDFGAACAVARSLAVSRPDTLSMLNSYGEGSRAYTVYDLCPY